uniref:Uncharacterized protein n=1 Tax=Arundo donax TaxID=35708 RepID=A0A0A8Z3R7_ARUDO
MTAYTKLTLSHSKHNAFPKYSNSRVVLATNRVTFFYSCSIKQSSAGIYMKLLHFGYLLKHKSYHLFPVFFLCIYASNMTYYSHLY